MEMSWKLRFLSEKEEKMQACHSCYHTSRIFSSYTPIKMNRHNWSDCQGWSPGFNALTNYIQYCIGYTRFKNYILSKQETQMMLQHSLSCKQSVFQTGVWHHFLKQWKMPRYPWNNIHEANNRGKRVYFITVALFITGKKQVTMYIGL